MRSTAPFAVSALTVQFVEAIAKPRLSEVL